MIQQNRRVIWSNWGLNTQRLGEIRGNFVLNEVICELRSE